MHQSDLFEPGAAYPADAEVTDRFARLAPTDLNDGEQDSVIQLALRVLEPKVSYDAFTDPETSLRYFRLRFAREPREIFICAFVDVRHRLIEVVELFQGTLDSCSVHPRVVAQTALTLNAAACLLVHNHPKWRSVTEQGRCRDHRAHQGRPLAVRRPRTRSPDRWARGRGLAGAGGKALT